MFTRQRRGPPTASAPGSSSLLSATSSLARTLPAGVVALSRVFRVYFRARDKSVCPPDLSSDILARRAHMADPGSYFRRPVHFASLRQVFLSIDKIIGEHNENSN